MKFLCEKIVYTDEFAGCVDLITGLDDFESDIEYNEDFHTYRLNGKIIPSVTQLLDDGVYEKVDKDILRYAQDKGTIVHEEIENWWKHQKEGFTSEFYEFLRLYKENKELFKEEAIFDYKTYNTNVKSKREKCYKQEKKYAEGIKYLTGKDIKKFYMIWLPHDKEGKVFDLKGEFENESKSRTK